MFQTLRKAVRRPDLIIPWFRVKLRRTSVREVTIKGELYYVYRGKKYPAYLNSGNACRFIADKALVYCTGKGLDIGAGAWPLPGAIPVYDDADQNAYNLSRCAPHSLDYVFSSHCL